MSPKVISVSDPGISGTRTHRFGAGIYGHTPSQLSLGQNARNLRGKICTELAVMCMWASFEVPF